MDSRRLAALPFPLFMLACAGTALGADAMPEDFVYLRDVDPTIQQDMRYAGSKNFTGKSVPGYDAAECVLVRQTAEALKRAQADLATKGLSLKIYDCYRPARAVASFVAWAKAPDDPKAKAIYYPNLAKSALLPDYIAPRSGHSRGATVALTLAPLENREAPSAESGAACTAPQEQAAPDGSLAMGTTFDCFDIKSNLGAPGLGEREEKNREILRDAMLAHGFNDYSPEWWHFTLKGEPYPDKYFDFPIPPRSANDNE
jgi:zinc D-Ala-D-Ala dipeptidase